MLPDQGYRTVVDEYGTMVEWRLAGKIEEIWRNTCCVATLSSTNMIHPEALQRYKYES